MKDGDLIEHRFPSEPSERDTHYHGDWCKLNPPCRTVVKKERFEEQWPEDPEFKAFADLLANSVHVAINNGILIGPELSRDPFRCPLGCLPGALYRYPFDSDDDWTKRPTTSVNLRNFYFGFGGAGGGSCEVTEDSPYYRLGQAYRKRFVKEKGE